MCGLKSGKQRRAEIKAARRQRRERLTLLAVRYPEKLRARGLVPVNAHLLAPNNSYGEPDYVTRGYYEDLPFSCIDCGAEGVWKADRQRWWYEEAKGPVYSTARRCAACRAKERSRKEEARRTHQEGLERKASRQC